MRLGAGLAAGARGAVVLNGDASLRRRPMERVAEPLRRMGAEVATTDGHAPVTVRGGRLTAIEWALPVPSAQVKSAVLLAGLRARGTTRVREPLPSRDHTERLLPVFGAEVARERDGVAVAGGQRFRAAGETTVEGAGELRVKESDRLAALEQLAPLGVGLRTTADGLVVRGGGGRPLRAGRVTSAGDHRIAMAFAVAGLVADGGVEIADPGCVAVSFPGFFERLAALGGTVEQR